MHDTNFWIPPPPPPFLNVKSNLFVWSILSDVPWHGFVEISQNDYGTEFVGQNIAENAPERCAAFFAFSSFNNSLLFELIRGISRAILIPVLQV